MVPPRAPAPDTWLSRQKARLALLWRALRPPGDDAREIILASLRRRAIRHRIGGTEGERAAHEIDTLRYQDWIGRFDTLKACDRETIKAHIEAAGFPVPLVFDLRCRLGALRATCRRASSQATAHSV